MNFQVWILEFKILYNSVTTSEFMFVFLHICPKIRVFQSIELLILRSSIDRIDSCLIVFLTHIYWLTAKYLISVFYQRVFFPNSKLYAEIKFILLWVGKESSDLSKIQYFSCDYIRLQKLAFDLKCSWRSNINASEPTKIALNWHNSRIIKRCFGRHDKFMIIL